MKKHYQTILIVMLMLLAGCGQSIKEKSIEIQSEEVEEVMQQEELMQDSQIVEGYKVEIDTTKQYQTIESFGTSGAWWSQYVGGWDDPYGDTGRSVREEIASLLFDPEYGIGLSSYRYNIGAGSADSGNGDYSDSNRRAGSFEVEPGVYDWSKDEEAVWFLEEVTRIGVEEVILFCNSPLERLTINGKAHMDQGGSRSNLDPENYSVFANYVFDVAEHFKEKGIPVKFISPINEPQWDWFGGQEGCHYEPREAAKVYKAFLEELELRPNLEGVELSGPESGEWGGRSIEYVSAILNDQVLSQHFTTIDNHSYWSNTQSKIHFKNWMDAHHKDVKIRMSEWCEMVNGSDFTMGSAINLSKTLVEDLTILDAVSWQNWVAIAPGGYRDGLIYVSATNHSFVPLKRLWAYGNYSKFIRPGYKRVDVSGSKEVEGLYPLACTGENNEGKEELVVVLINESNEEKVVNLSSIQKDYKQYSQFETSEERDLQQIRDETLTLQTSFNLAPVSINTLVLSK